MSRWGAGAAAGVLAVVVALAGVGSAPGGPGGGDAPALGPGSVTVDLSIDHSRFSAERVVVRPGSQVRFVVTNDDPIGHELIVGDDDVHARHATGTEPAHPPAHGELSLRPGEVGQTVVRFDVPGTYRFACHLPGHLAYGMEGEVVVA